MKKICIGIVIYFVSSLSLLAEIDVANYPLGMSNEVDTRSVGDRWFLFCKVPREGTYREENSSTGKVRSRILADKKNLLL